MNTKKAKRSGLVSYDRYRDNQLKDPEFAALYLKKVFEGGNQQELDGAIRDILRVRGNTSKAAKGVGLSRQAIYNIIKKARVDLREWQVKEIKAAVRQADAGDFADPQKVKAVLKRLNGFRNLRKAIGKPEVEPDTALEFLKYWNRTGSGKITSLGGDTRRMVREADERLAKGNRHPVKNKAKARKLLGL